MVDLKKNCLKAYSKMFVVFNLKIIIFAETNIDIMWHSALGDQRNPKIQTKSNQNALDK